MKPLTSISSSSQAAVILAILLVLCACAAIAATPQQQQPEFTSVESVAALVPPTVALQNDGKWSIVGVDQANQAIIAGAKNRSATMSIKVGVFQPWKRDGWGYRIVSPDGQILTNAASINYRVYAYFRTDQADALSKVSVGDTVTVSGPLGMTQMVMNKNKPLLFMVINEATVVGVEAVRNTTPAPAPTAPATVRQAAKNSQLQAGWDGPMQGGGKTLEDLAFVLNGFAKADPNPAFEDVEIYHGIKYLTPLNEAVIALGMKDRLPSMKKVVCPGFPRDSLNYTSFDGLFEGHYNRMDVVTDMAN